MSYLQENKSSLYPPNFNSQGKFSSGGDASYKSGTSSMASTSNKSITEADIYSLPDTGHLKYDLLEEVGQGTYGLVHRAVETSTNVHYAVKIIENFVDNMEDILQEYRILFEHSLHPNIPLLYGAYRYILGYSISNYKINHLE